MKILCPIMAAADVEVLDPDKYGTEFFCGYLPHWWIEKYNDSDAYRLFQNLSTPINNRNGAGANILSYSELCETVEKCHQKRTRLFLAVNAKYYPDYVYDDLRRYLSEIYTAGIRNLIVCDIGLISLLSREYPDMKVSVSCLNQATNSHSVAFYTNFPVVDRIVFPRHMSSSEIQHIACMFPQTEFEYFIFSNKCLYDDGYCRGIHEFTPICKDLFYCEFYSLNGTPLEYWKGNNLLLKDQEFRQWTRNESRLDLSGYCTASFACTACSLLSLIGIQNIKAVKLSIRGHSVSERLRQVSMAREAITYVEMGGDRQGLQKLVSSLYGKDSLCSLGTSCMMI